VQNLQKKRQKKKKSKESKSPKAEKKSSTDSPSTERKKSSKDKEEKSKSPSSERKKEKSEKAEGEKSPKSKKEGDKEESKSPKSKKSSSKSTSETSSPSTSPKSPKKSKDKEPKIVKQGWLEKKGVIRHNWTRRWMVLERKKEIRYYKSTEEPTPKGSISLEGASVYSHVEKKGKEMNNYFNIRIGNRDFLLRADTPEEKAEWVKVIKANVTVAEEEKKNPKELTKQNSYLGVVKQ